MEAAAGQRPQASLVRLLVPFEEHLEGLDGISVHPVTFRVGDLSRSDNAEAAGSTTSPQGVGSCLRPATVVTSCLARARGVCPTLGLVSDQNPGAAFAFQGPLWYWRGPAPYYFVRVPPATVEELVDVAAEVTYGWGMVPVEVTVGGYRWETSLWPKDGGYLVPIRAQVRRGLEIEIDELVAVRLILAPRAGRPIDPSTGSPRRNKVREIRGE